MNIIKVLTERLIKARGNNKAFPCKVYRNISMAEKIAEEFAQMAADYFKKDLRHEPATPCRYVIFYIKDWDRWVIAFDLTELLQRPTMTGGYLGVLADKGYLSF